LFNDFLSRLTSHTPPGSPPVTPSMADRTHNTPRGHKRPATELGQGNDMSNENYLRLSAKIDALTTTLSDTQDTLAKKMKTRQVLKRRGNQMQLNGNLKQVDFLDSIVTYAGAGRCEKIIETALEASGIMVYRNKLIQMADGSDLGWDLVNAYESNELAENESDERRMKRADTDARAEKKRKAEAAKPKGRGRGKPATSTETTPQVGQNQVPSYNVMQMPYHPGYQYAPTSQPFPANAGHFSPAANNGGGFFRPNFNRPPPMCYLCGQWGHVQRNCPNTNQENTPAQGAVVKA
jgi:hypothetical protein